jgi:PAS domain S-box-containing protein
VLNQSSSGCDPERTLGPINLRRFSLAAGSQGVRLHASQKGVVHMEGQVLGAAAAVWKRARRHTALLHEAGYLLLGLVSLATVTSLYFLLDVPLVAAAFTYLVVLVLLSLVSNFSTLIVLSFIGVCCLSYFFAPPIYSFRVDYAQDLITISAFVITSFVVNFLVTRVRDANQRLEVTNKALRIENVERKRAEQAQRESEDKLRQIIETGLGSEGKKAEVQPGFKAQVQAILNVTPAHTWYASLSGGLTFVNKRTADYLGLPKDHPLRFGIDVGAQWDAHLPFVHPDDRAETQENWSTRLRTGEGGEGSFRVRNAQGGYRWFLSRAEPLRASDGTIMQWVGVNLDIDELKHAEQALRELVEQKTAISEVLRAIANSPDDLQPIFDAILDSAKRLCRADMGSLRLFEDSGLRLVGVRGDPFLVNQVWSSFPVLDKESFLGRLATSRLPAHIPDLTALEGDHRDDLWVTAAKARYRTALFVPLLKDNEIVGVISLGRTRVQPFTDQQISLFTDFAAQASIALESTRRERQYREMQSELAHANRVATMGQLTASITHEVNQPITAAVTYALAARRFLSTDPPNFPEVDDALSLIVREGNRAGKVVERVRALVKKVPTRKDALAIDDAILEVIAITRAEAANNRVSVRTQFADGLSRVQGDRVQLQQVILNLIVNAIQAMRGIGEGARELVISVEAVPSEGGVRVGVRDTGPGLSPESLSRLFEPFYTTKPEGMGMGLSICRSIIEAHGGRLWAIPCEPHGALFQFTIPAD